MRMRCVVFLQPCNTGNNVFNIVWSTLLAHAWRWSLSTCTCPNAVSSIYGLDLPQVFKPNVIDVDASIDTQAQLKKVRACLKPIKDTNSLIASLSSMFTASLRLESWSSKQSFLYCTVYAWILQALSLFLYSCTDNLSPCILQYLSLFMSAHCTFAIYESLPCRTNLMLYKDCCCTAMRCVCCQLVPALLTLVSSQ